MAHSRRYYTQSWIHHLSYHLKWQPVNAKSFASICDTASESNLTTLVWSGRFNFNRCHMHHCIGKLHLKFTTSAQSAHNLSHYCLINNAIDNQMETHLPEVLILGIQFWSELCLPIFKECGIRGKQYPSSDTIHIIHVIELVGWYWI